MNLPLTCFLIILSLCISEGQIALSKVPVQIVPTVNAEGIQFDAQSALVWETGPNGQSFFSTENSGVTWSEIIGTTNGRRLSTKDDFRIYFLSPAAGVVTAEGATYCWHGRGSNWMPCLVKSVLARGKETLRIDSDEKIWRSTNAGMSWASIQNVAIRFDFIEAFDWVTSTSGVACVYSDVSTSGPKRRLVTISQRGSAWKEMGDPELAPGIWPTHLFFLNDAYGWIASDRDDGLYATRDFGKTWSPLRVPERTVSGIFLQSRLRGRIIGGVNRNVYETVDGGATWRRVAASVIKSPGFIDYFREQPLSRWNEFAVLRTLLRANAR